MFNKISKEIFKEDKDKLHLKNASDEQLDEWFKDILENEDFKTKVFEKYTLGINSDKELEILE